MNGPILITGGTGMVGRNVCDAAVARGFSVVAPSRRELNLLDGQKTLDFIRKVQPSVIVHAAGRVGGIEANMREPVDFLTDNLDIGRNIVLGARTAGVRRLINLGSSCMYPKDSPHLLSEADVLGGPLEPTNEAYAIAKIAVQRLCDYVRREDPAYQYKTLIPCNLFGRYDAYDPRRSHLAAAVIAKLHDAKVGDRPTVEIWGDGSARREFLYAGDVADAILTAIERFDTLPPLMNVGAGVDHSVNDYYRIAAEVIGYRGTFVHDLSRPVGMKHKLMDVSMARAWGWTPRTSLKDGLSKAYAYYAETVARTAA